jgi:cytochrome c
MKKFIVASVALVLFISCGGGDNKEGKETKEEKKESTTDITQHPDYQKGLDLIAQNDCTACHKLIGEERIQGPTYEEVANKYASYPDTIIGHLANKIIQGGAGVWAETPLMTPHRSLTKEEAEAMVKYILLLKK